MSATEWLESLLPVRPFWFVRTLSGISMDIGMTLLVFNLMMTAISRPAAEVPAGVAASGSPAR